jgi:GH43 family beta-xylosidase
MTGTRESRAAAPRPRRAVPIALAVLGALLAASSGAARQAVPSTFTNPIVEENSPDPEIQVFRGRYYMTYTHEATIVIRKARRLADLRSAREHVIWDPAAEGEPPERSHPSSLWAPEFHRLKGPNGTRWYVYYAASRGGQATPFEQRLHVLESEGDDPLGPYRYRGQVVREASGAGFAIDATVHEAADGRRYLLWSGLPDPPEEAGAYSALYIAEMKNPWALRTPRVQISKPEYWWEQVPLPANEGPEVLVHDDLLHVIYSASSCATDLYKLGRLTVPADADLLDPVTWEGAKHPDPVFELSISNSVYGPGHNGFFQSPDGTENWIVYHAHDRPGAPLTGTGCYGLRTARAQPFTWNPDGTPNFGEPVALGVELQAPSGEGERPVGPKLRVWAPRRQHAGRTVRVAAICPKEECDLSARGRTLISAAGPRERSSSRSIPLRPATAQAEPGTRMHLHLGLSRTGRTAVRRALRDGDRVRVRLVVVAEDEAANPTTVKRTVRLVLRRQAGR